MTHFRTPVWAVGWLCGIAFIGTAVQLKHSARPSSSLEMQSTLPRAVQVVMTAGDRYLAANIASFRVLVASTENMTQENYRIQARVQEDAAWLNPAHEDNYYIAAAILPWNHELNSAQNVLRRAAMARPFDWQPAFYFAFNELFFRKQPVLAAEWLQRAAQASTDEMQKLQLLQLASQWVAKSEDPALAVRMHRVMARETRHKAFATFLEKRAQRLENLMALEAAAAAYERRFGHGPKNLMALKVSGELGELPVDPFGAVYGIGPNGKPVVVMESTK